MWGLVLWAVCSLLAHDHSNWGGCLLCCVGCRFGRRVSLSGYLFALALRQKDRRRFVKSAVCFQAFVRNAAIADLVLLDGRRSVAYVHACWHVLFGRAVD
jgi:hypothetical protein